MTGMHLLKNEVEYEEALARIDALFDAEPGTAEGAFSHGSSGSSFGNQVQNGAVGIERKGIDMYRLICKEEDITHGQRFILNLMDNRQLAQFCRDFDLSFVYMFNVDVGKNIPPISTIYKLRHQVHPNSWF